jgi:hypothetical protein
MYEFEPYTIELSKPVKNGREEVTELVFNREPVVEDMRKAALAPSQVDQIVTVASRITTLPPSVIGQLAIRDFAKVRDYLKPFFDDGLETGSEGSES